MHSSVWISVFGGLKRKQESRSQASPGGPWSSPTSPPRLSWETRLSPRPGSGGHADAKDKLHEVCRRTYESQGTLGETGLPSLRATCLSGLPLSDPGYTAGEEHVRLPWWLSCKESACNAEDTGDVCSIPGSGRSPGVGHGNPLQYSCLKNSMNRGAWWAIVHGVSELDTTEAT